MKTLLFIVVLSLSLFPKDYDFRKTNWGDSKETVKSSENLKFLGDDADALYFKGNISGLEASVIYEFDNNKLYMASYFFDVEHTNKNDFIDDFYQINEILKEKYKYSHAPDVLWKNDLYSDDKNRFGFAVSIGHLELQSINFTKTTAILHKLSGDNFEISHFIVYKDLNFKEKKEENDF